LGQESEPAPQGQAEALTSVLVPILAPNTPKLIMIQTQLNQVDEACHIFGKVLKPVLRHVE
jgi:hypothetical protein